jgi:hypothetical protein
VAPSRAARDDVLVTERRAAERSSQRRAAGEQCCVEWGLVDGLAPGWVAIYVAEDEFGEPPEVAVYCPACAERDLR